MWCIFFFKQKTAYELRISDWRSDVCSSDLPMIAKLTGRLDSSGAGHAVIDVGGVGYLVEASARTLDALGAVGSDVTVHTEMLVGEDFLRLLGFARAEERDWFRLLTSVQGVGTKEIGRASCRERVGQNV